MPPLTQFTPVHARDGLPMRSADGTAAIPTIPIASPASPTTGTGAQAPAAGGRDKGGLTPMNKFLLAVALLAACASPALAGSGKVRGKAGYNSYAVPTWVQPSPRSGRLANALGGWNRGYPGDPYWEPCLSYQRSWGPGACGGGH